MCEVRKCQAERSELVLAIKRKGRPMRRVSSRRIARVGNSVSSGSIVGKKARAGMRVAEIAHRAAWRVAWAERLGFLSIFQA